MGKIMNAPRPADRSGIGSSTWIPGEFALQDAWFPVAHSPDIGGRPCERLVHSQHYFLFRDDTGLRATDQFPGVRPMGDEGIFTKSGEYPVEERFGHIWVWYGAPDRADPNLIPDIPFLPVDRAQPGYARGVNYFHCTYELLVENILDLTHVDFVHGSFRGADGDSAHDEVTYTSTSETITMMRTTRGRPTSAYQRDVLGVTAKFQDQTLFSHVHIRSGMCFLHSRYSAAPSIPLMQSNTPESRSMSRANFAFGIEQTNDLGYRRVWPKTAWMIAEQDESMLMPQNPRYLDQPIRSDCSTRFDSAGLHYRKQYNELVARQKSRDFAYQSDYTEVDGEIAELFGVVRPT